MPAVQKLIPVLALAAACASNPATGPSRPLDAQVVLAPGQTAPIEGTSLLARFQGVMGDSRCPADAFCIQGGDALVRIDVIEGLRRSTTYDLHTGSMKPVVHDDVTISLVQLSPYPFTSGPITPGDYRATLRVAR
jgi:hypothetical protein